MNNSARAVRVAVSADGKGLVLQAGAVLLWETMRVTGLGRGLSEGLARWRAPRAVHDPGKIVADLAAAVALGGDCLADIAVLREQPELAGPVASDPVVSRLVSVLAGDLPQSVRAIRRRGRRPGSGRGRWQGPPRPAPGPGPVIVDLDATIVLAHSEKEQAAATFKGMYGFHPMSAWADHGAGGNGGPVEPPPTRRDSRAAGHRPHQEISPSRLPQASTSAGRKIEAVAERRVATAV